MRVAVMQPYFFPYLGYFQLLAAADRWVVFDNVSFRTRGYIHRNRIWLGRHPGWFRLPVVDASQNRRIVDHETDVTPIARSRLLKAVGHGYARAAHREEGMAVVEAALPLGRLPLVDVLMAGLDACLGALGLSRPSVRASALPVPPGLHGQSRVLDLCRQMGAHEYVNLPGGRTLYDPGAFRAAGIRLGFIQPALPPYPQGRDEFLPGLSILDLIMHVAPPDRSRYVHAGSVEWTGS